MSLVRQLTPRQRAMAYSRQQNYDIPDDNSGEGWLRSLLGTSNLKSGPDIDAAGNPILAVPKTGFLTGNSQRLAARINAALIQQMMEQKHSKEMLTREQQHDVNMLNVAAALAKAGLSDAQKANLAKTLNIPIEQVDKFTELLSKRAEQNLRLDTEAEGKVPEARKVGAALRTSGYSPKDISENIPEGASKLLPGIGLTYDMGRGALKGGQEIKQFVESRIPLGDNKFMEKMGAAAVEGPQIPGAFVPADIRARAVFLSDRGTGGAQPVIPAATSSSPFNLLDISRGLGGLPISAVPQDAGALKPIPGINVPGLETPQKSPPISATPPTDPYTYQPKSLAEIQRIIQAYASGSPMFLTAP